MLYLGLGAVAGLLAGMFGVGGGLIIVPALLSVFAYSGFNPAILMQMAIATSLSTIIFTSLASSYAHYRHGAIIWRDISRLTPGIILGAAIGAFIADELASDWLQNVFAIFLTLVAIQILLSATPPRNATQPKTSLLMTGGLVTGFLSSLLGIGGGTITVPLLLWCGRTITQAVASAAACGFPIAFSSALFYLITGLDESVLPAHSWGYIYWPAMLYIAVTSVMFAPLGARWAHKLPVQQLKKIFGILLLLIAARMLLY